MWRSYDRETEKQNPANLQVEIILKRRAVITGAGLISSIGNDIETVTDNLKNGKSGLESVKEWETLGLVSTVAGTLKDIDQKVKEEILIDSILTQKTK